MGTAAEQTVGVLLRALLGSWVVVVGSYWMNLGDISIWLWPFAFLAVIFRYIRKTDRLVVSAPVEDGAAFFLVSSSLVTLGFLAAGALGAYDVIFIHSDALVSWNRWAIELSQNKYNSIGTAYPVLFPGLWSLIYKAQGNSEVWIFAKASILFLAPLLAISIAALVTSAGWISAALLTAFSVMFFFQAHVYEAFSGFMDIPVAILMLVSGCSMIAALNIGETEDAERLDFVLLSAAIGAGLAATTKQSGLIVFVPLIATIIILFCRHRIAAGAAIKLLVVAILPVALYSSIYFSVASTPTANLEYLRSLSQEMNSGGNVLISGMKRIAAMANAWVLIPLVGLATVNFTHLHKQQGVLGAVFLATSCIGIIIYSDCCSYDDRNGYWIWATIALSAICAIEAVTGSYARVQSRSTKSSRWLAATLIIITLFGVATGGALYTLVQDGKLYAKQQEEQWGLVPEGLRAALEGGKALLQGTGKIISAANFIPWLPGFSDLYQYCGHNSPDCVLSSIEMYPNSIVLVKPTEPNLNYSDLTHLLSNENTVGSSDGYTIYGPFASDD